MSVRAEVSDKWVRAYVADVAVVDSREALLFWEEHFPYRRTPSPGVTFGPTSWGRRETTRPASRSSSCPRGRSPSGST